MISAFFSLHIRRISAFASVPSGIGSSIKPCSNHFLSIILFCIINRKYKFFTHFVSSYFILLLLLVVCMPRIIYCVVQSSTFLSLYSLSCYQITNIYHITKFAYILRRRNTLKEAFCFLIQ